MATWFSKPSSAAIKIIAPPKSDGSPAPVNSQDASSQTLCSNIAKLGFCQFEGVGCIFYHPPRTDESVPSSSRVQLEQQRTASPPSSFSRQNVNAPVFVPKGTAVVQEAASSQYSRPGSVPPAHLRQPSTDSYETRSAINSDHYEQTVSSLHQLQLPSSDGNASTHQPVSQPDYTRLSSSSNLGETYYPQPSEAHFFRQPLNYHLYTPPSFLSTVQDKQSQSSFMSDALRQDLTQRAESARFVPPPSQEMANVPDEIQGYHTLVPLEQPHSNSTFHSNMKDRRANFGMWHSSVYKATNSIDGMCYALRRIENFRLPHETALTPIEQWSRLRHPSIVAVREAFTSRAFNDNSLIVAYDFYPNATTLFDAHLKLPQTKSSNVAQFYMPGTVPIPEPVIWSYVVQIGCAIRAAHDLGLALRTIEPTKVLLTGKNRIRIGSCGIGDVLSFDVHQDPHILQHDDLVQFGRLLMALCCNNLMASNNLNKSLDLFSRTYSSDLKNVALFLLSKPTMHKTINHLFDMIGTRIVAEVENAHQYSDSLEGHLMSELENGRLVRLLCKFGFINERPEFDRDARWSETGDRYIIKLFRDYVFHQVDENGNPVVNLSHVLSCLNKLDVGTEERIMLVSRDEQSCLVVSYKAIKICIESAFRDLSRASTR